MLEWLNTNGTAIQAIAAIVGAFSTAVLTVLTWRYVRLTRSLSQIASAQMRHLETAAAAATEQARRSLGTLALRLHAQLSLLDAAEVRQDAVRRFAGITNEDTSELERLARVVGDPSLTHASVAAVSLRWLLGLFTRISSTNPGHGYQLEPSEAEIYARCMREAHQALEAIVADARMAVTP